MAENPTSKTKQMFQCWTGPSEAIKNRRDSMDKPPTMSDLRLVLVGMTGAGKSSTGNTILGRDAFRAEMSPYSVTAECSKQQEKVFNWMVSVVDTPGLFDTSLPEDMVKREISKCINMSAPGPHAIVLVIKLGPFTAEEREAVKKVEEIFGKGSWRYTMILFTHGDIFTSDLDECLKEAKELQKVVKKVQNRYHIFNNHRADDRDQVLNMLEKVQKMVTDNEDMFYSNYTYQEVVEILKQRELELKALYKTKLEEKIKAVTSEYEKKLTEAQEEKQQLEKRLELELEEVKRYYHVLGNGVRKVVEQMTNDKHFNDVLTKFHETLNLN